MKIKVDDLRFDDSDEDYSLKQTLTDITTKIETLFKKFEDHNDFSYDLLINKVNERFSKANERLKLLEEKISSIEDNLNTLENSFSEIDTEVTYSQGYKLRNLESEIKSLKSGVSDMDRKIRYLE